MSICHFLSWSVSAAGATAGAAAAGKPESSRVRQSQREPETDVLSRQRGEGSLADAEDVHRRTSRLRVNRPLTPWEKTEMRSWQKKRKCSSGSRCEETLRTCWRHEEHRQSWRQHQRANKTIRETADAADQRLINHGWLYPWTKL